MQLFEHGVVWVDVGNKYISASRGIYIANGSGALQDFVMPLLCAKQPWPSVGAPHHCELGQFVLSTGY